MVDFREDYCHGIAIAGMIPIDKPTNFKDAFCASVKCAPEKYVEEALFRCYFEHAVPVARILYLFKTESVRQAINAINELGKAQSVEDVPRIVSDYKRRQRRHKVSKLVKFFEIRLSGKRMMDLFVSVAPKLKRKEPLASVTQALGDVSAA